MNNYDWQLHEYMKEQDRQVEIDNCEYCNENAKKRGFYPTHFHRANCRNEEEDRVLHCRCDVCF